MSFYTRQNELDKNNYKKMLTILGNMTKLFSENDSPYLAYRAHENIFCKYFGATNLARVDCSADAIKDSLGVGLKTWVGRDDQKVAEFGKLRHTYSSLSELDLVKKISMYRNERIRITRNMYNLDALIYHVIKRVPGAMQIFEYAFDEIDIDNISVISGRGNQNNTYFTDGNHDYHFSTSKNTLYMIFDNIEIIESFEVEIMQDPFDYLMKINESSEGYCNSINHEKNEEKICLRLYSINRDGVKKVFEKSGLNQWNASGRKRHHDELYIPYPVEDRNKSKGFFPSRNTIFKIILPDNQVIDAKVCQAGGKAIMSNPNRVLGEWLLRKVFEVESQTIITYEMLEQFGVDSVIFTKHSELEFSIDFAKLGSYEEFY